MTVSQAIAEELAILVAEEGLHWVVAISPPAGHIGPCFAITGYRVRFGQRSSVTTYPSLEVDFQLTEVSEEDTELATAILHRLAETEWQSHTYRAIAGRLQSVGIERQEGPREERWQVTATIEYQVATNSE